MIGKIIRQVGVQVEALHLELPRLRSLVRLLNALKTYLRMNKIIWKAQGINRLISLLNQKMVNAREARSVNQALIQTL
jgi:hypothetical protein